MKYGQQFKADYSKWEIPKLYDELISAFANNKELLEYRIEVLFDGENANEDRLAREAFDIFMNDLLLKTFDGREQYVPVISPEMTEDDYQLIGSIMYLFFINFGIFPIQLAQKSLIHIFGNTLSPSILLSSFFTTISNLQEGRKSSFRSLSGDFIWEIVGHWCPFYLWNKI